MCSHLMQQASSSCAGFNCAAQRNPVQMVNCQVTDQQYMQAHEHGNVAATDS